MCYYDFFALEAIALGFSKTTRQPPLFLPTSRPCSSDRRDELPSLPRVASLQPDPALHHPGLHTDHAPKPGLGFEITHPLRTFLPRIPHCAVGQALPDDGQFRLSRLLDRDGLGGVEGGIDAVCFRGDGERFDGWVFGGGGGDFVEVALGFETVD